MEVLDLVSAANNGGAVIQFNWESLRWQLQSLNGGEIHLFESIEKLALFYRKWFEHEFMEK